MNASMGVFKCKHLQLSESALRDLFRLSDCHFYWTVPFTLSWSLFQAMACGVIPLVSDSAPTRDIVINGQTGLSVHPYELDRLAKTMLEVLSQPSEFSPLREAARHSMVKNYSFEICLPKLAEFYLYSLPAEALTPLQKEIARA
jgi:glycosyltransferase involved in cell wall biosynthesis